MATTTSPFVGRSRELAVLGELLEDVRRGVGAVATLSGEAGIGKTATARVFADLAQAKGFRILWGTCYETESSVPFEPWVQAVPAGGEAVDQASRGAALASDEAQLRAYEAFTQVLVALADEPVVIVLDDLHWADPASLGLLAYVGRVVSAASIVLVGTYREAELELTHPLARTLADVDRHVRVRRLPLGKLDAIEVRTLLAALADGPISRQFAETVARETGGNPFFVSEVALELTTAGAPVGEIPLPESVRQAVGQRLARLSRDTARVLSVAAAFAGPFRFDALQVLTELEEDALLDCVDEALRARMLAALEGERYEFAHALVRHAIYDELSSSRQARLHRRIAEALERLAGIDAAELASQYYRSRTLPGAVHGVRYALVAAEHAKERYAYEQAVVFLCMARELAAESEERLRADIVSRLAEAQAEAVMVEEARQSTEEALALLDSSGATAEERADFVRRAAWALDEAGAPRPSIQPLVQRGLELAGERLGLVWARLKLAEYPLETFRVAGVRAGRWLGFDPEAVAIARRDGDERDYAKTIELMDWRDRSELEELRALAGRWRDARAAIHVLSVVTRSLLFQHGAFAEAVDVANELHERAERVGSLSGRAYALVCLSVAALERGDIDQAHALADQARAVVARLGEGHRQHGALRFLAHALMRAEGPVRPENAVLLEQSAGDPRLPPWMVLLYLAYAAQGHAAAGEDTAAERVLAELVPILERVPPRTMNQNGAVANAAWAAWLDGAAEHAAPLRRAAAAVIDARVGDYPGTSLELAVAWMAILAGDRSEALTYLQRARATLTESGQLPLLRLVDDAEHAIARETRQRPAGLTPRELEILRAVATGQSNREIASTLVLSVHTVERHIANIYRKIDARNRAEATAFALRERL
jgi:DNA-binding CsgD family transcriptional regulator